ncbi:Peptidase M48, partial [Trinorchestia longiramus]
MLGFGGVLGGATSAFYWQHCQVCPFTQHSRFYLFQPEQMQQLDDVIFEEVISTSALMKSDSRSVRRVLRVSNKLVSSVKELCSKKWKIAVVDDNEMNAYCLSSGYIVIHTGMLAACENDHQLAAVLSHELAHVLLQHQNLQLSQEMVVDAALLPLTFLAWCVGSSDLLSVMASWLLTKASSFAFLLPYSRLLEHEADHFGLFIMAM